MNTVRVKKTDGTEQVVSLEQLVDLHNADQITGIATEESTALLMQLEGVNLALVIPTAELRELVNDLEKQGSPLNGITAACLSINKEQLARLVKHQVLARLKENTWTVTRTSEIDLTDADEYVQGYNFSSREFVPTGNDKLRALQGNALFTYRDDNTNQAVPEGEESENTVLEQLQ